MGIGDCYLVKNNYNLIFEVLDEDKVHYKLDIIDIPSKRGRKPKKPNKIMTWNSKSNFIKFLKKNKGILITNKMKNKLLSKGL